jgi:hypothetical protein
LVKQVRESGVAANGVVPSPITECGGESDEIHGLPGIGKPAGGFEDLLVWIEEKIPIFQADFTDLIESGVVDEDRPQHRTFRVEIVRKPFPLRRRYSMPLVQRIRLLL